MLRNLKLRYNPKVFVLLFTWAFEKINYIFLLFSISLTNKNRWLKMLIGYQTKSRLKFQLIGSIYMNLFFPLSFVKEIVLYDTPTVPIAWPFG